MKDLFFYYKFTILRKGDVHSAAVPAIIRDLNHIPMGALKYKFSIAVLKELVGKISADEL